MIENVVTGRIRSFLDSSERVVFKGSFEYFLLYVVGCSGNPAKFVIREGLVVPACNGYRLVPALDIGVICITGDFSVTVYLGQQSVVVVMMFGTDAILVGMYFLYGSDQLSEPIIFRAYCTCIRIDQFGLITLTVILYRDGLSSLWCCSFCQSGGVIGI